MDATTLLRNQLAGLHGLMREVIGDITPEEWTAPPYTGGNPLGFLAWHLPATQDWALHTWIQGAPELRTRAELAAHAGLNVPLAPFGMTHAEAEAIARAVSPADVIAYADAVFAAASAWLDTLSDADLERVPDTRAHGTRLPIHQTPAYLEEVADMYDLPVWRLIAGPCYGHIRQHIGEILMSIALLRAQ